MLAFILALSVFSAILAQENPCPDYHITQDNRTHEITPEEIRLYQTSVNQRPMPSVLSHSVSLDYNSTGIYRISRHIDLSTPLLSKMEPKTNQSVHIISMPVIPNNQNYLTQTDCVQVNCPSSFGSDVVCWKCVESTLTANIPSSQTGANDPVLNTFLAKQRDDLSGVSSEMTMIYYGDLECPSNNTNNPTDECMPQKCPQCEEFEFNREWFIVLLVGLFAAGCLIAFLIFCICRKITK